MTEHIVHIDDIEELVIAKYFIEQELLKKKEIEHKYTLQEFVQKFIKLNENIAIYDIRGNVDVVPFFIYTDNNDIYLFFSENNEHVENTINFLKNINYNLKSLKPYSGGDNLIRLRNVEYDLS